MDHKAMPKNAPIGDLLVREGIIDNAALSKAQDVQAKQRVSLVRALELLGIGDELNIVAAIAKKLRLESLRPEVPVLPDIAALLPPEFCRKRGIAPLSVQ